MSPRHSTVLSALQRQRDGWRGASRRNMGSGRGTENSGGKPVRGSSRKVREISRDALRKAKPGSLPMHIKSSRYYQLAIQEFVLASSDPNAILQFVKHRIPDMNARCVVTTIYRLSKLSQRSPERDSQSQLSGSDWGDGMNLDFFHENPERKKNSGREEASTSWRHSETFQKLLKRLFFFVEFSHSFRPDLVAQTAVASVGLNFHSKELFEMLMRQALERPKSFSPQELVLLYWSFAKVGHVNAALLFGLSESVRSALSSDSLLPGQLVSMLWSLTQLGLAPSPLLSEALSKVAREVEKYSPRDLAELLWVCAAAEGCSYATFRSLLRHAVKTMVKKDSEGRSVVVAGAQELSVAVWASAVAGVRDEESLKTLSCALAAVLVQSEEDLEDAKFIVESEKSLDRGSSASGGGASGVILPDDISDVRERIRLRRQLVREEAAEKRLQEAMGGTSNKKTKGRGQTGIGDEGEDEEVVDFSPEKWSLGVRGIANMLWGFSVLNFVQPELFRLAISKLRRMGGGGEDGLLRATEGEGEERREREREELICFPFSCLVGHVNAALLFGLSESVRSALSSDSLLPGQLVSMLWSLTQLGLAPSPLLSEALSKVAREVEKYSPRDLAELLWVCAAAEGCSYATFRSLLRHAVKTMVKKDSEGRSVVVAGAQELSVAVWASAVAGVRDEESLKTLSCALAAVLVQSEEDLEDAKFIVESEKSLDRGSSASGGGASGVILPDDISDVRERIRLRRQLVREEAAEKRLQEAMGGTSNKKTKGRGQTGIGDEGEDEEVVDFSPEKWSLGVRGIANMLWGFSVLNFVQPELFRLAISKLRRMGGGGEDGLLRATEGEGEERREREREELICFPFSCLGSEKSQSIRRSQIYQAHLLFLCLQTLGSGGQGGGKGSDEEVKGSRGGGGLLSEKEAAVFRKSMSASERSKLSASSGEEEEEEIEEGEENPGAQSEKTAVAGAASPQQKTRSRRCVSAVSSSLHSQISDGLHRFLRVDHENEFFAEDALLVDIAFPELKVAIEAEGPFHFKSRGLSRKLNSRTLFKQRLLRALGWKVTSIPFFQWEQKSHRSRSARAAFLLRLLDSDPSTKSLVTPEIREEIEQMKKGKERGERGGSRGSDQEEGVVARTREVNSSSQEEEEEQTEIEPLEDWEADLSVAVQDFPLLPDESSFVLSPLWALRDRFGDWQEVSDAAAFQREAQKRSEERKRKKREKREELIRKREEERLQKEKEEGKEDEPGKESSQGETVLPAESGEEVRGESGVFGMNEAVLREQIPNRSSLSNLEDETEEEETLSQTSLEASRRVMQSLMEEGPIEYLQQEPADQAHELRERARDLAAMRAGEASWASRGRRGKQRQRPAAQIKESGSSFSSSQGTAQT
uniref:RAP domain-containing protein n=1 Tax=Chromera velia CCMP2878 TaxID=1169474 RepID=A0A0G4G0J1_9ALVE|eukprot:Cvel_19648.t1-p1 / transcript=Cvel_19648.t1 / gene=Cvel_19648 / organism=Chromera_velia_CCMP2878 / gene_product=hypothetical protein / transcript_product=hypothetical protein / location=Cvel_scaffold1712:10949-17818(+) / protein_length=1383 / sequence_SO=supercontig / SO=protein_coding / is_pseudo=false